MKNLLLVWLLSNGADVTTTEMALKTGYAREINPIFQHAFVPIKVGVTATGVWGIKKYHKTHSKETKYSHLHHLWHLCWGGCS